MAYNTTPFHGRVARIEKNDVAVDYSVGYTLNVTLDMADASRQGQKWKEGLPGLAGATGTMEYMLVLGNTEQKAIVDNLVTASPGTKLTDVKFLLESSTSAFTANIYVTGMNVSTTINDTVKGSFPFQIDGALTVTASA